MRHLILAAALGLSQSSSAPKEERAVLAGGCFWGVEWVYEHLRGVRRATSGYVNGVESVEIVYDPSAVSYRQLLEVFFTVAHDPTSRDRQGPDAGPEYRAVVFSATDAQRAAAASFIAELTKARRFSRPIVTEVQSLTTFRVAEAFHQDFAERNPTSAYIQQNDVPKIRNLARTFPELFRDVTSRR